MVQLAMPSPREWEVAGEHWLRTFFLDVAKDHTWRVRRAKFGKQDLFGCDVVALGTQRNYWAQVTSSQQSGKVRERRRALEQYPWKQTDRVFVLEGEEREGVVYKRTTDRFFRVHEFAIININGNDSRDRVWMVHPTPITIPPEWFKVNQNEESPEEEN